MSQRYAVEFDGQDTVYAVLPLEAATRTAKRLATETGKRINLYKLVQTHTYMAEVCRSCGEITAEVTG